MLKSKWSAEVESAKSIQQTCQLTAADVTAIAMIRNNAVWIHGLIKHCLRSWTDKYGHFYACVREMTGQGPPALIKHVNNFWCDLFCDAGKTTRSGAMNTDKITIPQSKLPKILSWTVVPTFANVHWWLFMHGHVNQGEVVSTMSNFQNGGCLGTMQTLARFTNLN